MSAARKSQDWEEKTAIDMRPASQFAATVSGERQAIRDDALPDLFADEDGGADLEATRVREVPSSLLRAAAAAAGVVVEEPPPTVPRPALASKSAIPTPVVAFEPQGELLPVPAEQPSRWRSPAVALAAAFFVLSLVVAAIVMFASRG